MIAQHKAHLHLQISGPRLRDDPLPLRPIVPGRLVVPHVLAGLDDALGLVQTLVVAALGGNGDNGAIAEQFFFAVQEADLSIGGVVCDLLATLGVGFVQADDFDFGVVEHCLEFASGVAVLGAVLRHADHGVSSRKNALWLGWDVW